MPRLPLATTATAVVVALTTLAVGMVAGCSGASAAAYNDADVTFASEMVSHHEQAVDMAAMTEGRPLDPAVRELAEQIGSEQTGEIDTMTGWLKDWDKPAPDHDTDSTMDMGGAVDGMMTDEQMSDLADADDADFQHAWLELMVAHHEGALEMARTEADAGRFPAAVDLAGDIQAAQAAQIAQMRELIAAG